MNKEQAKETIKNLIAKYETEKAAGKILRYSEEETKRGFIEPLFQALGWDFSSKQEITLEEQVSGDRVDYGFYLKGRIKFYLEAKKLSVDLYREEYAKQAIRYSWNKGVTWAVLTDFENLIVFNALSPEKSLAGKKYLSFSYEEYLTRFDELWRLSKESFGDDILDKEAEKVGKKLQKVSVTETLAKDLNECRELLTTSLSQFNEKVDPHLIDEGVQKLLNRLVFIRCAEDRKIEPSTLMPLIHEWKASGKVGQISPYQVMIKKFRELDAIYNSNLFDDHPFEKWDEFGGATEKVIEILEGKKNYLEYDFSIIPADVLGNVYENYLGHQLKKSKKQEKADGKNLKNRKEQGIYYTPKFIVDYIVQNALGPVLDKCKSINDLQKIKILDPACGSGSFLVAAMIFLIKKYEEFGVKPSGYLKIQILQNNIYGVDLDKQAVELARLNLLLNTFDSQIKLPGLENNIKNGNSLISGTDKELIKYFGKNYRGKKPFSWQEEFPEVFKQGGFDCIIGNPPYISVKHGIPTDEDSYYLDKFYSAKGQYDLFLLFIEKAFGILKNDGLLGFIIPKQLLTNINFKNCRELLFKNSIEVRIANTVMPFSDAQVETIIMLSKKGKGTADYQVFFEKIDENGERSETYIKNLNMILLNNPALLVNPNQDALSKRLQIRFDQKSIKLKELFSVIRGLEFGKKDEKILHDYKMNSIEIIRGEDLDRYKLSSSGLYIGQENINKDILVKNKIIIRRVANKIIASLDRNGICNVNTIYNLIPKDETYSAEYVLAILNSRLMNYLFKSINPIEDKLFPYLRVYQIENILIYRIDLTSDKGKKEYDELISMTQKMLILNEEIKSVAENSDQWHKIKDEIAKTDKRIDEEVYELYGLTEKEIKIVGKS